MSDQNSDNRQEKEQKQSKKNQRKWLNSLRKPEILKKLIQWGVLTYKVGKWLIDLLQD